MAIETEHVTSSGSPIPNASGTRPAGASIAVRLVVFAVVLAIATATAVGVLSYTRARRALEHEARERLALLADDAADDFHRELADRIADVSSWTHLEIMRAIRFRDVDHQLADFFAQLLGGRALYRGVACLDGTGAVVASAGELPPPRGDERVTAMRVVTGDADGRPLRVEAPVPDPDHAGVTIGTLVAVIEPRRLLRSAEVLRREQSPHTTLALRTASGVLVIDTGADGSGPSDAAPGPRLHSTTRVAALADAEAPAFTVTVREPVDVALAPVNALRTTLLRTAGVAVATASILGALVALWIGAPIRRLTRAVQRVSTTGELAMPTEAHTSGEVGVLASAFEEMMTTVAEQQAADRKSTRLNSSH